MDYSFVPILERIKKIKAEQKLTNEALSKKSDIPLGTLSKVLASIINDPKIGIIIALTDALTVDINLLIHDQSKCYPTDIFSAQEQNLVKKYRALTTEGKNTVGLILDNQYEQVKTKDAAM